MFKRIAIIGYGWVGTAMHKLFPNAVIYDIEHLDWSSKEAVNKCDVAFICVPTPRSDLGRLNTTIVESCVEWCKCPLIVIRSTVNPGTTDRLIVRYGSSIVVQPEYLGETPRHPMGDPWTRNFLVIGGVPEDRRKLIDLYTGVFNANVIIRQVSAYEAEIIKLSENRAIAFKVAQCQELYDVCQAAGVDYYTIRDVVYGDDPRFNLWWTFVYPDKRGMNSKCIPKDVFAWAAWAESVGYDPVVTKQILERNEKWIA